MAHQRPTHPYRSGTPVGGGPDPQLALASRSPAVGRTGSGDAHMTGTVGQSADGAGQTGDRGCSGPRVWFPVPSCPYMFQPQQLTVPAARAHELLSPPRAR